MKHVVLLYGVSHCVIIVFIPTIEKEVPLHKPEKSRWEPVYEEIRDLLMGIDVLGELYLKEVVSCRVSIIRTIGSSILYSPFVGTHIEKEGFDGHPQGIAPLKEWC